MKYELDAAYRLLAADWFDTLSDIQKKEYLKEHPNSKYGDNYNPSESEDDLNEDAAEDAPEEEKFLSKLRNSIIEALGGIVQKRTTQTVKGFASHSIFENSNGETREVKLQYTPGALQKGPGNYEYGYWKDKDTYIQMTKKEFKGLNKKQLLNIQHRQELFGLD